jgi:hypothetical protein
MGLFGGPNSAITAVGVDDTAYPWRQSLWNFQFYASSNNYQPPYPNSGFTLLDSKWEHAYDRNSKSHFSSSLDMVNTLINNNPTSWNYGAYANYADDKDTDCKCFLVCDRNWIED